jgi:NADPH2:quinone reductase
MVASGRIVIEITAEYPLAEAARAHADLEARRTTGSIVLTV